MPTYRDPYELHGQFVVALGYDPQALRFAQLYPARQPDDTLREQQQPGFREAGNRSALTFSPMQ